MKKLGKKLISILLVLCIAVTMTVIAIPNASAGIGTAIGKAVGKKALELGMRFACAASTQLAAQAEDDDASIVVNSIINFIIMDAHGSTTSQIKQMCEEILKEIAELDENLTEYTSIIDSALTNDKFNTAKMLYSEKWQEDVLDVIEAPDNGAISDALDVYTKYFIVSYLNANGEENPELSEKMIAYWDNHFGKGTLTEEYYSNTKNVTALRDELELAFINIQGVEYNSTDSESLSNARNTVYNNIYVYQELTNVIAALVDNYIADSVGGSNLTYTVADCAATDAYYALPFSFQQHDFIETAIKKQVAVVTLMEMCLNEYLSMQGNYLSGKYGNNWETEVEFIYTDNSGQSNTTNYATCSMNYQTMIDNNLGEATRLMGETKYKINTTAYTGVHADVLVSLDDYMSPEDAQRVKLTINGYEETREYLNEISGTEADDSMTFGNTELSADKLPKELYFYRIMAGDTSKTVYYILDPAQFENISSLDIKNLATHIERYGPVGGSDILYGDLYPVSVDYYNATKTMSDGVNNFSVSSSEKITEELASLVNVPYFSAVCKFNISTYLNSFIPTHNPNEDAYLLTSTYKNNYNKGLNTEVKEAEINLAKTNTTSAVNYEINAEAVNINEQIAGSGFYTMILVNRNKNGTFSQNATLTVNDNYNGIKTGANVSYTGGTIAPGETAVVESGKKVTIEFSMDDYTKFESLKLIRKNAEESESVLIDSYSELQMFEKENAPGVYSIEITMPYSETEFVLTTKDADNLAFVEKEDPAGLVGTFAICDNLTKDIVANVGEYAAVEAGEEVTFKISLRHAEAFGSLVAVTNGKEVVVLDAESFKAQYDSSSGFQYVTTEMPEGNTDFILKTNDISLYSAFAKEEDPADSVASLNIKGKYNNASLGSYNSFRAYESLEISFSLKNDNKFDSLVAVNRNTNKIETLVNADELSSLAKDGNNYIFKTLMPAYNVDFIIVTKQAEEFVPNMLDQDEKGTYIIYTYEDLRSMAYFVNTGAEEYTKGNYILANDINVLNRPLEPIGLFISGSQNSTTFAGSFDGQGYTISNFKILSNQTTGAASLFDSVSGEIKNLKLSGDYTVYRDGDYTVASACGVARILDEGASVTNVQTNLNYIVEGFENISVVAGIAKTARNNVTIEKCMVNDIVNLPDYSASYSGLVDNSGSNATVNFIDCANTSEVTLGECKYAAGITYSSTWVNVNITDCYVACDFNGDNLCPFVGAEFASKNVTNSYYLDTCVGDNSLFTDLGTAKTIGEFESGEVAYLLNNGVTDGTQVWLQNLDNGKIPDTYPLFEGATVYKSAGTCVSAGEGYTNILGEISHNYNNYHVCKDCITLREGEAAGIYGFSIGLGGNISVQYYTVIDEEVAADPTAKMIFTVPDTGSTYTVEIPVSEAQISEMAVPATGEIRTLYVFECEVAAKEIPSDIYCQVVTNSRESDVFRYAVKDYAEVILANPQSFEKEIPLVKALLNYGGYAQLAFEYNTDNLANTSVNISEEEKVLSRVDFDSYAYSFEGAEDGVEYYGSAISLKSETAIKHYFYFEDEENIPTVTVNGKEVTPVKNGGYYEVKISDIPAHKLHEMYEVKVGGFTLNYGVFSYCYTASSKTSDQKLVDVANALHAYNQAAIEYIS